MRSRDRRQLAGRDRRLEERRLDHRRSASAPSAVVCAKAAPNSAEAPQSPRSDRTLIPSLPSCSVPWDKKVIAMGLVGKELFDAVAVPVDPGHEFPDTFVHNFDVQNGMLRCDNRRCTCEHLHLHAFDVDLDEVDLARRRARRAARPAPHPPDRARNAWRQGRRSSTGSAAAVPRAAPTARPRQDRSTLPSPFSATSARIAAAARGSGSIGMTRSACHHRGEEQRVVAGIGADIDDAQAARQPLGEKGAAPPPRRRGRASARAR